MKLTPFTKPKTIKAEWHIIDAEGQVLGDIATLTADMLRGKRKPVFNAHILCGDNVVIINAEKVVLTRNKIDSKMYYTHSGYLGHIKAVKARHVLEKQPKRILHEAVYGMLPKNKLRKLFMDNLHIYAGPDHKHAGQNPTPLSVK